MQSPQRKVKHAAHDMLYVSFTHDTLEPASPTHGFDVVTLHLLLSISCAFLT